MSVLPYSAGLMPYNHELPSLMAMASSSVLVVTVAMGLMFEQTSVAEQIDEQVWGLCLLQFEIQTRK